MTRRRIFNLHARRKRPRPYSATVSVSIFVAFYKIKSLKTMPPQKCWVPPRYGKPGPVLDCRYNLKLIRVACCKNRSHRVMNQVLLTSPLKREASLRQPSSPPPPLITLPAKPSVGIKHKKPGPGTLHSISSFGSMWTEAGMHTCLESRRGPECHLF